MIISKEEIHSWDSNYRLKFVNGVSGYKGVHLIGTEAKDGNSNLAIFNSIVHVSSHPARIGFILRPVNVKRDTYTNIIESKFYTINHVHKSFLEKAHYTSAKFQENESEFELCNLEKEYLNEFQAPFVAESNIKIGLKLVEDIKLEESECHLVVGEVQFVNIKDDYVLDDGQLDLEKAHDVCVTGLNQYSSVNKFVNLPYARVEDKPDFGLKKRPDNVVFDEESQTYNAKSLTYGSNLGAPTIVSNNLSSWKTQGVLTYNHVLKSKIERIKEEYDSLVEEYKYNELLYNAKYEFEPIIGEVYHLYQRDNKDACFLSLIPPHSWKRTHLGSFKLSSDKVWTRVDE